MIKGIECICGQRKFYYPGFLEKKEKSFAFNTFCGECKRILAVVITKKGYFIIEANSENLIFEMDCSFIDKYGIFFYQKVGEEFVEEILRENSGPNR